MATPTVTGTVGSGYTAGAFTLTYSHVSTGDPIYVIIAMASAESPISVTFGGVSLTLRMAETLGAIGNGTGSVWSLIAPTVGTANVVITVTTSASIMSGALNVHGGPPSGGLSVPTARATFATSAPVIIVPAYSESLVVEWVYAVEVATPTDGSTARWQVTNATCTTQTGGSRTTCSWSLAAPANQSFTWGCSIPSGDHVLSGGTTQLWMARNDVGDSQAFGLPTGRGASGTEDWSSTNILTAGTVRSLTITKDVAPGVGKSWTYTIYRNNIATGLTVTITGLAVSASASVDVVVYPYDRLYVAAVAAGGPAGTALSYCAEFEAGLAGYSVYGTHFLDGMTGATNDVRYCGPLFAHTAWTPTAGQLDFVLNLCGAAGTLTEWAVMGQQSTLVEPIVAGQSFTFVLVLNGVVQDGSGATANTTIVAAYVLGDSRVVYRAQFSMAIAVGDELYVRGTITGSAAAGIDGRWAISSLCVSTTPGEFTIGGGIGSLASGSQPYWASPTATSGQNVFDPATESTIAVTIGTLTAPFAVTGIVARLDAAPTGVKSYTFVNRKTLADVAGRTTLVIAGATTKAIAGGYLNYVAGDTLDLSITPSGTPSGNEAAWALRGRGAVIPPVVVLPPGCPAEVPPVAITGRAGCAAGV